MPNISQHSHQCLEVHYYHTYPARPKSHNPEHTQYIVKVSVKHETTGR